MNNKAYIITALVIIALCTLLYIQKLQNKLSDSEHQVYLLEEALKINPKKMDPIIEIQEKKIEIIKRVPVYIDNTDTCEGLKNELEATKAIINNF